MKLVILCTYSIPYANLAWQFNIALIELSVYLNWNDQLQSYICLENPFYKPSLFWG